MTPDTIRAHRHSSGHRQEVLASEVCGCFHCCKTFPPSSISEWIDEYEGMGQTALCPHCGIDSVIGVLSGYPVTPQFLQQMHDYWFHSV